MVNSNTLSPFFPPVWQVKHTGQESLRLSGTRGQHATWRRRRARRVKTPAVGARQFFRATFVCDLTSAEVFPPRQMGLSEGARSGAEERRVSHHETRPLPSHVRAEAVPEGVPQDCTPVSRPGWTRLRQGKKRGGRGGGGHVRLGPDDFESTLTQ